MMAAYDPHTDSINASPTDEEQQIGSSSNATKPVNPANARPKSNLPKLAAGILLLGIIVIGLGAGLGTRRGYVPTTAVPGQNPSSTETSPQPVVPTGWGNGSPITGEIELQVAEDLDSMPKSQAQKVRDACVFAPGDTFCLIRILDNGQSEASTRSCSFFTRGDTDVRIRRCDAVANPGSELCTGCM